MPLDANIQTPLDHLETYLRGVEHPLYDDDLGVVLSGKELTNVAKALAEILDRVGQGTSILTPRVTNLLKRVQLVKVDWRRLAESYESPNTTPWIKTLK